MKHLNEYNVFAYGGSREVSPHGGRTGNNELPEFDNFFLWLHKNNLFLHNTYDVWNKKDQTKSYTTMINAVTINGITTWTKDAYGQGNSLEDAIRNLIKIVKGKTLKTYNHSRYKNNTEIEIPEDFELWSVTNTYNL